MFKSSWFLYIIQRQSLSQTTSKSKQVTFPVLVSLFCLLASGSPSATPRCANTEFWGTRSFDWTSALLNSPTFSCRAALCRRALRDSFNLGSWPLQFPTSPAQLVDRAIRTVLETEGHHPLHQHRVQAPGMTLGQGESTKLPWDAGIWAWLPWNHQRFYPTPG